MESENLEGNKEGVRQMANSPLVAGSILIAGILIAGSIIYVGGKSVSEEDNKISVNPITKEDHILGSMDADIKFVEFSDTECPFCKQLHFTMKRVIEEYGPDKKVAWVYRHFPIDSLHKKARKEAEATECAAELGGNLVFWKYIDRMFEITPSNDGLDIAELPKIAEHVGLNVDEFNSCLESGKYASKIDKHIEDGVRAGVEGTPHMVLITKRNELFPIQGARSYDYIKSVVEAALAEK